MIGGIGELVKIVVSSGIAIYQAAPLTGGEAGFVSDSELEVPTIEMQRKWRPRVDALTGERVVVA